MPSQATVPVHPDCVPCTQCFISRLVQGCPDVFLRSSIQYANYLRRLQCCTRVDKAGKRQENKEREAESEDEGQQNSKGEEDMRARRLPPLGATRLEAGLLRGLRCDKQSPEAGEAQEEEDKEEIVSVRH